jgi:PAS domain-containing protein
MRKHLLKITWACMLLAFVASLCLLPAAAVRRHWGLYGLETLIATGLAAVALLSVRVFLFHRKLGVFVRQLLAGRYESGIQIAKGFDDEISAVEKLLNKLGHQLRTYDELFAERVSMSHRGFELLQRSTDQPLIMADSEKQMFRFNPPALELFGVEQKTFSFDALEKLPANAEFSRQFRKALETEKVPTEATLTLQIPVRNEQRTLRFKVVPLKDYEEKVRLVFFLVQSSDAGGRWTHHL